MIRRFAAVLLLAASVSSAAMAQAPAPDAARVQAAADLVATLDMRAQMRRSMAASLEDIRSGAAIGRAIEANPAFRMVRAQNPAKYDEVLRRVGTMQATVTERVMIEMEPEVVQAAVDSYARHFTAKELKALASFYRTDLGKRLRDELPAVLADSAQVTQTKVMPRMEQAMTAIVGQVNAEFQTLTPPPAKP